MQRRARRRGVVAGLVALLVLGVACVPPAADELAPQVPPADLRVMTWNLLGAQADGNLFDEHAGFAARVDQLRPDVVVLQEAQADDVDALLQRTREGYQLASYLKWTCDLKSNAEGVAVLVHPSVRLVDGGGTHVGATCADPTVRRVLVWADVLVPGAQVRVYGTHLTAGGGAAAASRDAQIAEIRARIAQDTSGSGAHTWVLAGDVNTRPGEASYELLLGSGAEQRLRDAAVEVSPDAGDPSRCPTPPPWDVAAMAQLLADPEHVRRCGFTAGWPKDSSPIGCDLLSWCASWEQRRDTSVRERIDGVFLPADERSDVVAAQVPNRADQDWAAEGAQWYRLSDHLPVVVDLELVPERR